ncbi:MAG TPA: NUDIX domain-containing protein [Polyangiaceae bacterium]|jgi:8-oxo-dGTP pyrophosphatase MutT (NUDIX family)|nr:NUDIX domain-containing protein [Polyangiaceae bacterium]
MTDSAVQYEAAGGVLVHAEAVLVLERTTRSEIRLPKGHIEPGESAEAAAIREVREESGYAGKVVADLGVQLVEFKLHGRQRSRSERYFLMELADDESRTPAEAEAQFQPRWLGWDEAIAALTFEPEKEWVRRARRHAASVNEV